VLTTSDPVFPAANNGVVMAHPVKVELEHLNMVAQMGPPKLLHYEMNSQDGKD
jgi:hypothetical protein